MKEEEQPLRPDYIFEISWEVCNKVGGIHTVLATKTLSLVKEWEDNYILIGPDVWKGTGEHPEFAEDPELFKTWKATIEKSGLKIRAGRWKITGNPLVVLIDYTSLFPEKNEIFKNMWLDFQVDSLSGQWDYIEPALFGYAAGQVIECFYHCHLTLSDQIIAHFHEWLTAAGILYLEDKVPQVGTVFTTHATTVGRAIAGNEQPFYSEFQTFNAEQEAKRWNIISKHSLEKSGAKYTDCFTTVSEITARECRHFLGRSPDVLTPNGFDDTIVPESYLLKQKRLTAWKKLMQVAKAVTECDISEDSLMVLKSGRYEFRNKGIDVFIAAMGRLNMEKDLKKPIVAFICVPGHHTGPRKRVQDRMAGEDTSDPIRNKYLSHHLQGMENDPVLQHLRQSGLNNEPEDRVKVIFAPVYLDGSDGIFNMTYYDLLPGFDIAAFPSYYEPWGYTPLESLAFHVPAITTDVAGFGQFIKEFNTGVYVLHRDDSNREEIILGIAGVIKEYAAKTDEEIMLATQSAWSLSKAALWKNLVLYYKKAYSFALQKSRERKHLFEHKPRITPLGPELAPIPLSNEPVWRKLYVKSSYPGELEPLEVLSKNLWWSWNHEAFRLFESIDPLLWRRTHQNPIAVLNEVPLDSMKRLLKDSTFRKRLDKVYKAFVDYMSKKPDSSEPSIAYFCMEFGLHNSLKLYSGGLGILAGDFLKEASDANKALFGVGLLYRKGYFRQQLTLHGDQLEEDDTQKFTYLPLEPLKNAEGEWVKVNMAFPGRTLYAKAWQVPVGRTRLYLLDTDIPENRKEDRVITDHLYAADPEYRLKQELLLGIGGVRLLHTLGLQPDIYHCNEGHAAFAGLERIYRKMLEANISFDEALEVVKASMLFTTHTPVAAGHDRFREEMLRVYLAHYPDVFNISWNQLMTLGKPQMHPDDEKFCMSYLAARVAQEINGVSLINEAVGRRIFHPLWESFSLDELHIGHVTNGVHFATWTAPEWHDLYERELRGDPRQKLSDPAYWEGIKKVPDEVLWKTHIKAKQRLTEKLKEKLQSDLTAHHDHPARIADSLRAIDGGAMFIGFARRSVPYKRSTLLFRSLDRLARIVNNPGRPVVIFFAGKAHPSDGAGKHLIKDIVSISYRPEFIGKVVFLENYDMELASYLVQGVDLWLNTPQRGMEASGTSGMKAALNGVLNLSVLDGWWNEAYDEECGWALGDNPFHDPEYIDEMDAEDICRILETEIVPAYFDRTQGVPQKWVAKMKNAIAKMAPVFNTGRMLEEYYRKFYSPLYQRSSLLRQNNFEQVKALSAWKKKVQQAWPSIRVEYMDIPDIANKALALGDSYTATLEIDPGGLSFDDLSVEIVFIARPEGRYDNSTITAREMTLVEQRGHTGVYTCSIPMTNSGVFELSFRFYPKHPLLAHRQDFPLVRWL